MNPLLSLPSVPWGFCSFLLIMDLNGEAGAHGRTLYRRQSLHCCFHPSPKSFHCCWAWGWGDARSTALALLPHQQGLRGQGQPRTLGHWAESRDQPQVSAQGEPAAHSSSPAWLSHPWVQGQPGQVFEGNLWRNVSFLTAQPPSPGAVWCPAAYLNSAKLFMPCQ